MIEIKELNKSFGNIEVLKNINMSVPQGKIYGLIGRSGTGKSTLLRCINGLETYDSGSLVVNGIEVKNMKEKQLREFRKDIGMIFQQFSLLSRLTVEENVALPLRTWKYDKALIQKKTKQLLDMVGIPDKLKAYPGELSGGQKQRVAIARALTMDPKILLCDEATSALDPKTAKSITELLCRINHELGITVIVVTHQMSVLRESCEEIVILENGRIASRGSVEEIFLQQPQSLRNLIGERDIPLPDKGTTLRVILASEQSDVPVITQMARDLNINFTILGGEMDRYREKVMGTVLIHVDEVNIEAVKQYLANRNVKWTELKGECSNVWK